MSLIDYLTISQTVFYLSFSIALIALGIVITGILYYLFKITRHVENISKNLENASNEVRKNVIAIIEELIKLPFISKFIKKKQSKGR